jgi:hypothetical protein
MLQYLGREIKLHTGFAVSFAFNLLPTRRENQVALD